MKKAIHSISLPIIASKGVNTGIPKDDIQKIVDKSIQHRYIFGALVSVGKDNEIQTFASGNMSCNQPYFIASIAKLYTTAVILKLRGKGQLKLDDKITKYLSEEVTGSLHVYKGKDYSGEITIRHLLSNTSGIADYFEQKQADGKSLKNKLTKNMDVRLSFEEAIALAKTMSPKFPPGKKRKVFYSDTNFQLLGKIIENITGNTIADNYESFIYDPLGLKQTYLYQDITDTTPANFYYKKTELHLPGIMASFTSDGGIVSTAEENMIFLKAFFNGDLFPSEYFKEMQDWKMIFPGFSYGMGLARFKNIGIYELIGHPGASGSFAYYCPKKDACITGTINQISKPGLAYKLMMRILRKL